MLANITAIAILVLSMVAKSVFERVEVHGRRT